MSPGRAVLVICMFLLASSSHLQAARVAATTTSSNVLGVHGKKGPVSISASSSTTGRASPCLHEARLPAALSSPPAASEPADIVASSGGRGRALWSTPSDGVGH
uniref:Uncharacterized protein n=1 Tax=Zea mays TaxID=4577 RepID=A0A804MMH5_MAIZE